MLDSKTSIEMQKVLKQLMGNPKEIESFKKEPDTYLKKMDIEFGQEMKLEVAGILGYLGYDVDDELCPRPYPKKWPFPWPKRWFIDGWCGNEPRPPWRWPFPWPWAELTKSVPTLWDDLRVTDLATRLTVNQKEFEDFKSKPESFLKEYGIDANQVLIEQITANVNNQMW